MGRVCRYELVDMAWQRERVATHEVSPPLKKRRRVLSDYGRTSRNIMISMPLLNRPSTLESPCCCIIKNKLMVTVYVDEWIYTYSTSYIFPHFSHLGSYLDEGRYQLLNPSSIDLCCVLGISL